MAEILGYTTNSNIPYYLDGSEVSGATNQSQANTIDSAIKRESNDIDTLYGDIYSASGRNNDGLPMLAEPIDTTLSNIGALYNAITYGLVEEAALTGWVTMASGTCVYARDTSLPTYPVGDAALKITSDGTYRGTAFQEIVAANEPLFRPERKVSGSVWTRPGVPSETSISSLEVAAYSATGKISGLSATSTGTGQAWERLKVENYSIPYGTQWLRIQTEVASGTRSAWFTGLQLEPSSRVSAFKEQFVHNTSTVNIISTDGVGVTIGLVGEAAVTTDANGTLLQYLRGLISIFSAGATGSAVIVGDQITPGTYATHRENISSADGTTPPIPSNVNWLDNSDKKTKVRLFVYVTFTGGTSPTVTFRPYIRTGGSSGKVGGTDSVTYAAGQWVLDVQADGDSVLGWVETISGSPSTTDVDIFSSWR